MPSVVRKDIDNNSAQVTVTIKREELQPKIDAELKRFRSRAGIKGFRQGQAPMPYIRKMFGASIVVDTFNDMMSQEIYDYLRNSGLNVLGQPLPAAEQQRYAFKIEQLDPEYSVTYDIGYVNPIELNGLDKDQVFERLVVSDLETLADRDLDYARSRMGKQTNPEDDIQENDILRISAKEVDGDWETTITTFVKDIADDQLKAEFCSKKKGDPIRFNTRLLEETREESHYRKYIINLPEDDDRKVGDWFEGVIEEVSRVEKADLDEEFFQNYFGGGVSNPDEAREQIKKGIQGFYDVRANALLMRDFQERLLKLNAIELPEQFLRRWLLVTNENELTPEAIEEQFPAFAENLRWTMISDKVKEQFGLEVTDADVQADFAQRVRNYFQVDLPDHIIQSSVERLMKDEKDVDKTRRDLETDKIFQAIREQVTIVDKAVPSEEFHKILDTATHKEA
jgi:trigger factor